MLEPEHFSDNIIFKKKRWLEFNQQLIFKYFGKTCLIGKLFIYKIYDINVTHFQ